MGIGSRNRRMLNLSWFQRRGRLKDMLLFQNDLDAASSLNLDRGIAEPGEFDFKWSDIAITFPVSGVDEMLVNRVVENLAYCAHALSQGLVVDVLPIPEEIEQFATRYQPVAMIDQVEQYLKRPTRQMKFLVPFP